ncbi:hypothetical protein PENTCL1PPCAC_8965, partial [Pristionchus entomophagus]
YPHLSRPLSLAYRTPPLDGSRMRWSLSVLTALLVILLLSELVVDASGFKDKYSRDSRRSGMKRRCHQCNMPHSCSSGSCVGDVCVKSVAASMSNTVYVSKGCENYTEHSSLPYRFEEGCKQEWVFGVESLICYCSDADYCNSSGLSIVPLLPVPLLLLLRYLP